MTSSTGLCDILCSSTCHSSLCYSLEKTLSEIDLELPSLQSQEESLKQTRIILANERNKSRVLSSVHRLPPEILATIFEIATSRYTRHDRTASNRMHSAPITLASVSSFWRQISLGTPSLWSYIDLVVGGDMYRHDDEKAMLWVERSCNAILYVNIQDRQPLLTLGTVLKYQVTMLLGLLTPLMQRVHALDISTTLLVDDAISPVLALWAKHASPDIKKTLQILVDDSYDARNVDLVLGPVSGGSFSADELNSFLRSFNRLLLQSCRISESVMFHEGLVELHLQDISPSRSLTQQELVAILATCPRLRILALIDCEIGPSEVAPRPVALNHLEFLSLESEYDSGNFVHVLPLLAIGSEGLSMSLTMGDDSDLFDEAKAFFGRTKVTRLHVWGMQEHVPLSMLSYPIPYLEILALEYFDISPPGARNLVPWPRLHTLHLQLPLVDTGCLRRFVELQHSLKKLHVYEPMTEAWPMTSMAEKELVDLAESMHMVEDFEIQSDWKSGTIGTWDFVISEPY